MFTPIIQLWQKNRKRKIVFFVLCLSLLSLYPIYKNFYNGAAVTTYERHIALIKGESEYYNPWQYRMLCPLIIEGMIWVYDHTVDKIYPIEEHFHYEFNKTSEVTPETQQFLSLLQKKGVLKYLLIFIFFRFLLNFSVFLLAYCLWRYFINNNWLIFFGLIFLSLGMGNAVIASDLTFNTYLDNVFYLLAACIIVYKKNKYWLIPLILLAAMNRETSMMIPFLFFISFVNIEHFKLKLLNFKSIQLPPRQVWLITAGLYFVFFLVFFSLRQYYGYKPAQVWKVPPGLSMLKLNLASTVAIKSYFEMLGVFSVIPFLILYKFKTFPSFLKIWFLGIVPAWFAVHLYTVVTYQTRLFLVPTIVILLPMFLYLIENRYALSDGAIKKQNAISY